jgi:hypothetical protein
MSKFKRAPLIFGDVALVPLTRGQWAVIDVYDLDAISAWYWYAVRTGPNATWYARRGSGGRGDRVKLHNAIMGPGLFDHIDGDGLNNRRANLRPASIRQNVHNSRMPTTNKSGFKGVFKPKGRQRWDARIQPTVRGKNRTIYLGSFLDKEDAARAYDDAARKIFGEFARLNFPDSTIERNW